MRRGSLLMTSRNGDSRPQLSYEELLRDNHKEMNMLDRALEDSTPEHKARVRGLLIAYDVEHDNEFYMLFVAFGHLTILVEETPEKWRDLFDDVHTELKQWSQENFKSLESIKRHAKTSADLIAVLRQLLDSMKTSETRSSEMRTTLSSLKLKLSSIESSLASMKRSSSGNQSNLNQISQQIDALSESKSRKALISNFSLGLAGLAVLLLMFNGCTTRRQLNRQAEIVEEQTRMLNRQDERIVWLLQKAEREECLTGIKPPSDKDCQQYF